MAHSKLTRRGWFCKMGDLTPPILPRSGSTWRRMSRMGCLLRSAAGLKAGSGMVKEEAGLAGQIPILGLIVPRMGFLIQGGPVADGSASSARVLLRFGFDGRHRQAKGIGHSLRPRCRLRQGFLQCFGREHQTALLSFCRLCHVVAFMIVSCKLI